MTATASQNVRRAYCACGHWHDNHDGACLLCPCEDYHEPEREPDKPPVYAGPVVSQWFGRRRNLGHGPVG